MWAYDVTRFCAAKKEAQMKNAKGTVDVVLVTFAVVVGVALERFLTDEHVFIRAEFEADMNRFWWLYALSFTALFCLAMRFLVGSDFHLRFTYVTNRRGPICFFTDLVFLVAFGVILVRAALSESPCEFMYGLIRFLVLSVIWDALEMFRTSARGERWCRIAHPKIKPEHAKPLIWFWLVIDLFQLAATYGLRYCDPQVGIRLGVFTSFSLLAVVYVLALFADLLFITSRDLPLPTP